MINLKNGFFCLLISLFGSWNLMAQTPGNAEQVSAKTGQTASARLNQTDAHGRKQGMWYIEKTAHYDQDGYILFGPYIDNKKQGLWYKMSSLGQLISIQNYTNDVLNGTSQFYENGNLVCIGHYRGLNPAHKLDTISVTDPETGVDHDVVIPSEQGTIMHGFWRYYNPVSGQLIREELYQAGTLLYEKDFAPTPTMADSVRGQQQGRHLPIDIKAATRKIPDHAKQKIGY